MTTATDILTSWAACAPVLSKPTGWLVLLRIAAAGEKGITKTMATYNLNSSNDWVTMNKWEAAGLIRVDRVNRARRIFIQPKGLSLLRVAANTFSKPNTKNT